MSRKTLYTILSLGLIGTFFGHGAWAVGAKESFVTLLTGSVDNVFGATMSLTTAERLVRTVGVLDIIGSIVMVAMLIGVLKGAGGLYRFAYSKFAIVFYAAAALWAFITAASRLTAAGEFYPEVWDLVERAPNFIIPIALIYIVLTTRAERGDEKPLYIPAHFYETITPKSTARS